LCVHFFIATLFSTALNHTSSMSQKISEPAYIEVLEEFTALTAGRKQLSVKELTDLRRYVKSKTDLSQKDDDLTDKQQVWKSVYYQLDAQLQEVLRVEQKTEVDMLEGKLESLSRLEKALELKLKKTGPKDHGKLVFYLFLIGGFILSWILTASFYLSLLVAAALSIVALLIGTPIMQSFFQQVI
jgi:hypothetical protein